MAALSVSFKSVYMLLAELHFVCAEKLVEIGDKTFGGIAQIDGVLSFKLSYNLL